MPLTLDDLDSPVTTDMQTSFVGGQFSNAVPLQLDETQSVLLEDCEVSITGSAATRRGTAQLGTNNVDGAGSGIRGLGFYSAGGTSYPVAVASVLLKYLNVATWTTLGGGHSQVAGTTPITFVEGNTFLYITDGTGKISKWDGTAFSDLVDTDHPPHDVQYLVWHPSNRLIAGNCSVWNGSAYVPSVDGVFFSGILDDTLWAGLFGGFQLQIGAGDGQPISGIASWQNNNLVVFKRNSTWTIGADPLLDVAAMPVNKIHDRIGCIAARTITQCGSDIFFLSAGGVHSLQQVLASDSRYDLGTPLSFSVDDVIKRINPAAVSASCAIFWKNLYILALPLDTSTTTNYILIYNTILGKWTGGWTNLPVACMAVRTDSGIDKLMIGLSNDKKVIELLDYVLEDAATDATYKDYNGVYVNPHIICRGMIGGDLDSRKKGLSASIKFNKSKGLMQVNAIFDEGAFEASQLLALPDPRGVLLPCVLPVTFPIPGVQPATMSLLPYPEYHQIQIELTGLGAGRKEVRQVAVQSFPEPSDLRGQFQTTISPQ